MHAGGHTVAGSDRSESALTKYLNENGISVSYVQDGSAIPEDTELFVYSEAIPEDAPERVKAKKMKIKQQTYFEALGELTRDKQLIAICGTHGKSSTTAMATKVLIDAGLDPSVVVGTKMFELDGKNWRKGESDVWIVEACEYRKSFLHLDPKIIILTNVDGDHFDAFKNIKTYEDAFKEFFAKLPEDGIIITHASDTEAKKVAEATKRKVIDADKEPLPTLRTPGLHMRHNGQLVLALAKHLKIETKTAMNALSTYHGSWRRMEEKGIILDDVELVDDYAHHPVEISATLNALKEAHSDRRIVCVFQPHTHDRTLTLWKEFAKSFVDADLVIIADVYDARPDTEHDRVDMKKFVRDIEKNSGKKTLEGYSLEETLGLLKKELKPHDLLVIMGAGTVSCLSEPSLFQ